MNRPPLKDQLEVHGLMANKRFGQHFLLDLNVTAKIVRLAGDLSGRHVIEVGPGPGGLTRAILDTDVARVTAIEMDPRFIPLLSELDDPRLTVIEGDALKVEPECTEHPTQIIANLPYNVGTALLIGWLKSIDRYERLTLMFQLEVAERIVAKVGDDAYGRLAVLTQAVATATLAYRLPARAFTPPPKVDSAVVVIEPRPGRLDAARLGALEKITAAAFGQRRKMLRQSLKPVGGQVLCEKAGIDPSLRAENLTCDQFIALTKFI